MNDKQKYYAEYSRWLVREDYFGKWDSTRTVCICRSIDEAAEIVDAMLNLKKDKPFKYCVEKIADDYIDVFDNTESFAPMGIVEMSRDYSEYLKGIYATEERNENNGK